MKLSVCVITWNQEKYISKTIEGILSQKTNFEFEIIIGVDLGSDKTLDICLDYQKRYPNHVKVISQCKNLGMHLNWRMTISHSTALYVAICEGDDYWMDDFKLQKQIEILDRNENYGLCCTNAYTLDSTKNKLTKLEASSKSREIEFNDLILYSNPIFTLTAVFRRALLNDFRYEDYLGSSMIDYPIWLHILSKAKGYLIHDKTSVYRKLQESASHSKSLSKNMKFERDTFIIKMGFIKNNFSQDKRYHKKLKAMYYYKSLTISVLYGGYWSSVISKSIKLLKIDQTYLLRVIFQLLKKTVYIVR